MVMDCTQSRGPGAVRLRSDSARNSILEMMGPAYVELRGRLARDENEGSTQSELIVANSGYVATYGVVCGTCDGIVR